MVLLSLHALCKAGRLKSPRLGGLQSHLTILQNPVVAGVSCTQLYVHALGMLALLADRPARLPSRPTNVSFCLTLSLRRFPKKVTLCH